MATLPDAIVETSTRPIGRRGAPRARLHLNAVAETTTEEVRVVVRNLSCTGAMLEGRKLPAVNRTAVLKRESVEAIGIVVWQEENRCGFHFFEPISHDEVVALSRRRPEAPVQPDPFHWSLGSNVVTAEEWRQAQEAARRERISLRSFS